MTRRSARRHRETRGNNRATAVLSMEPDPRRGCDWPLPISWPPVNRVFMKKCNGCTFRWVRQKLPIVGNSYPHQCVEFSST